MSCESWTTDDLEALEKAIAQGVQRVKYTDKEIEYRSLDDMLKTRDLMRRQLGCAPQGGGGRLYASHSKGTC